MFKITWGLGASSLREFLKSLMMNSRINYMHIVQQILNVMWIIYIISTCCSKAEFLLLQIYEVALSPVLPVYLHFCGESDVLYAHPGQP